MRGDDILLRIRPALEERLQRTGYVLVDARFYRDQAGRTVLEALVDREEGGITLDECADISRQIGASLDESGLAGMPYVLDVSSPGLDRPLVTPADYRRARGREIRVFLKEPVDGRIEYAGALSAVHENGITLAIGEKTLELSLDKINKAKQVIQ